LFRCFCLGKYNVFLILELYSLYWINIKIKVSEMFKQRHIWLTGLPMLFICFKFGHEFKIKAYFVLRAGPGYCS